MSINRILFFLPKELVYDRSNLNLEFLEGVLNKRPLTSISEASDKAELVLDLEYQGGECNKGIADNFTRSETSTETAILIHVSEPPDAVGDALIARQARELYVVDAIAIQLGADDRWKPRWVHPTRP